MVSADALASAPIPSNPNVAHHQVLLDLQLLLQHRYDVMVPERVDDFICHDSDFLKRITGRPDNPPEMLLVREDGEDLDITLFLDSQLLKYVEHNFWCCEWSEENFDSYCALIEGVSHFVYLVWNARHGRAVKLIEMELQAEVDKFVFAAQFGEPPRGNGSAAQAVETLHTRLFHNVTFRANLAPDELHRYESANTLAGVYCKWLASRFDMDMPDRSLGSELARFYRMKTAAKISHITGHLH